MLAPKSNNNLAIAFLLLLLPLIVSTKSGRHSSLAQLSLAYKPDKSGISMDAKSFIGDVPLFKDGLHISSRQTVKMAVDK